MSKGTVIAVHVGFMCVRCRNPHTVVVELTPVNPEDLRTFAIDADAYRVCNACVDQIASGAATLRRAIEARRATAPEPYNCTQCGTRVVEYAHRFRPLCLKCAVAAGKHNAPAIESSKA